MSATATPTRDQHLALMLEMGADQYDPMPPGQYLAKKNERQTLTPRGQQLLAWIQEGCIRLKPGAPRGGRNAFATADGKRPLRFTDAAAYFAWDMPAVSRVWNELQQKGYVKKDTLGRLCMIGEPVMQDEQEIDTTSAHPAKKVNIPGYVREQFATNPRGREAQTAYVKTMELINSMNAEAIAGTRAWGEKFLEAVMAFFDVKLRRHPESEEEEKEAPRKVQVNILQMSVQDFLEGILADSAQPTETTVYSAETEPVQALHPYTSENREYRVSSEDTGTESVLSCEDSLTHEDDAEPIEQPEAREPEAAEPTPAKTLPVDEESKPAAGDDNNTVVAFVENYFEQPLNPTLRNQWANFAHHSEVATASAVRFLMEKTAEVERREYELEGNPAATLLKFARVDIKRWKKTNRAFIARDLEREEAQARATAAGKGTEPPEHPTEALIRSYVINQEFLEVFPDHKDALETRERFLDDREKLEKELARLLDGGEPTDRAMIERLKTLLSNKAEGAAG